MSVALEWETEPGTQDPSLLNIFLFWRYTATQYQLVLLQHHYQGIIWKTPISNFSCFQLFFEFSHHFNNIKVGQDKDHQGCSPPPQQLWSKHYYLLHNEQLVRFYSWLPNTDTLGK